MEGISMNELYEYLSYNREIEFIYYDIEYVLQPEIKDKRAYLVIWSCTPITGKCIARVNIPLKGSIPTEYIDKILSIKCFDGKSFLDIEKDVTVTCIL